MSMPSTAAIQSKDQGTRVITLGELGELIMGIRPGRETPEQLTLYKSVGVAVQDAAATALVIAAARTQGVGAQITL